MLPPRMAAGKSVQIQTPETEKDQWADKAVGGRDNAGTHDTPVRADGRRKEVFVYKANETVKALPRRP